MISIEVKSDDRNDHHGGINIMTMMTVIVLMTTISDDSNISHFDERYQTSVCDHFRA